MGVAGRQGTGRMAKVKSSAVFLTYRDCQPVGNELKKLDWDGLVDEVFREEVDQFYIENGVQALHIRQNTNSWAKIQSNVSSSSSEIFAIKSLPSSSSTSLSLANSSNKDSKCGWSKGSSKAKETKMDGAKSYQENYWSAENRVKHKL